MAELSAMQALIDSASNLAAEIDLKEEKAANARSELQRAKDAATKAWNDVYVSLLTLAEERQRDDSFKSSKLGYMLMDELRKGRAKR